MRREVLRMERVSLLERGVIQLHGFTLNIFEGEVVGLLPVNNHGLTALLQLLQHNTPLRSGYIYYKEKPINTWRSSKQRQNRIGLIQSESSLVEGLSVADNIFVLRPGAKAWLIRSSTQYKQLMPFLEQVGIYISADTYVSELSPFEKVVVDVLKSVMAGCKLIVLREIRTSVGDEDLRKIHSLLRYYTDQGISFLYIDSHYEELRRICCRVALMSNGGIIKTLKSNAAILEPFDMISKPTLFGGELALSGDAMRSTSPERNAHFVHSKKNDIAGQASRAHDERGVFEAKNVTGSFVYNVSFTAAPGKCVVLQGESDQMLNELLQIFSGQPASGELLLCGKKASLKSNRDIAIIQELPTHTMLFNELSYMDNLCFSLDHRLPEIWRSMQLREGIRREYASTLGADVFDSRVDKLSEVQKYRLVYTRVVLQKPKVAFVVKPFRRTDVELRVHIWALLKMLLDKNISVVILTINLADCVSLADNLIRLRGSPAANV